MTNLGALGTAKPEAEEVEEIVFDYFDEKEIHANPELTELDYIDFLHIAGRMDPENPASFGAVKDFVMLCILPSDFTRFWKAAKRNRQGSEDLFETCQTIVEAVTERPTGQLSGSASGPGSTGTNSEDADLSLAKKSLDGRPDLQLFVEKAATG